jgi:hypothetical protein
MRVPVPVLTVRLGSSRNKMHAIPGTGHQCPVPGIACILPEVSWLFFKARAKHPYLSHTGRASNEEKQPTGPSPEGCDENGPAAAVARQSLIDSDRLPPRALPAAHFDRNKIHAISGTGH